MTRTTPSAVCGLSINSRAKGSAARAVSQIEILPKDPPQLDSKYPQAIPARRVWRTTFSANSATSLRAWSCAPTRDPCGIAISAAFRWNCFSGVCDTFLGDGQQALGACYTPRHLANLLVDFAFDGIRDPTAETFHDGDCGS
ncbi:MAG: hypothetical protein EOP90_13140 [Lysobacteraceae bacterium]|nr:MAG: hypothetical protein EOP90_13140 [Xanthomonadaceae bacterium]